MAREWRLHSAEAAAKLLSLRDLPVNYSLPPGRTPAPEQGWHVDALRQWVAREPPGDPVPGGAWDIACGLVRDYQFPAPGILGGLYRRDDELLGRNMLLEGRFCGLRFDMGVRVTSVTDEVRGEGEAAQRVWGWGYRTLLGHLEEGELTYEVIKHLTSGDVEFRISGYSRRAPIPNPLVRVGFMVFGRMTQRRFYRHSAERLRVLTQAEVRGAPPVRPHPVPGGDGNLVVAPSRSRAYGVL
ncbi:DUF1990 family protein [Streptomyces tsukubensis]|uniref:DUF1990 domain-containing protein n=2 Tax=Streptomyces TaxID=1883 RepID=A0A1V4A9B0_9ACTN|nr:DUF1990 family protein [Streptomyces tsukubensis]OON78810.1 hypothetical protein B1H18_15700 [Streptomyces tsukubensis]QFR94287.1 DUF1990 family protein [Streptomyces tsukubensis]CBY85029.1 hypothetical protein [Streptomyces tacrolimicus]